MSAGNPFLDRLHAQGAAEDRAGKMSLYGWLIGSWEMEATLHADDGSRQQGRGEIHFGWVLEGRAIQDVWILPGVFHGTTLRVYDPGLDAWHILWNDPVRQYYARQIGRARGKDIVQEGKNDAGDALELYGHHGRRFPLARRTLARRRRQLAAAGEFLARRTGLAMQ